MAPVVKELERFRENIESFVCVSGQHRDMLDQVLALFEIVPDFDLNLMKHDQNLWTLTSDIVLGMRDVYEQIQPDIVLVHGDTTTSFGASLSAFYGGITVGHVEAGLRTHDKYYPFPEEMNRVITDSIAAFHFAPTPWAAENIRKMAGHDPRFLFLTGNTIVDALLYIIARKDIDLSFLGLSSGLKTILVTSHRRENFGDPLVNICQAILELVRKNKNIEVVFPVHPNPNVKDVVHRFLAGVTRIKLIEPLDYGPFTHLMKTSSIIVTDSGGIQEEAPSLDKPVLVMRDQTERPEAVDIGTVRLVGTKTEDIVQNVQRLLDSEDEYASMANVANPYGDGLASRRIVEALLNNKEYLYTRRTDR